MDIYDVRKAKYKAQQEIIAADQTVKEVAALCAGRLKVSGVSWKTLDDLKKELRDFNMHTGQWKER